MSRTIRNSCILVITSLIWGAAFVAQTTAGEAVGPYSFNCIRSFIGCLALAATIPLLDRLGLTTRRPASKAEWKVLLLGGASCGIFLFLATTLQQMGIFLGTSAGKAGFLTACYILLVPILGIVLGKKCGWNIWLGVVIAVAGLYLLCMNGSLTFRFADLLILGCAVMFSFHIMVIDYFSPKVDGVRMSCIQFGVCGMLGLVPMLGKEMFGGEGGIHIWLESIRTLDAWIPILYAGVLSCGVAYTLQIIGQDGLNPTLASLIMSLESVFSVIAGAILLHQILTVRESIGCVLVFAAIVLAQIPVRGKKNKK